MSVRVGRKFKNSAQAEFFEFMPEVSKLLCLRRESKAGADANYSNFAQENKTAYEFAAEKGDKQMMALLKKYGAAPRINSKNPMPRKQTMKISEKGGVTISR